MSDDLVAVGKIISPHGIKGAVKVYPLTDFPLDRFKEGSRLFLEDKSELIVEQFRELPSGVFLVYFKDIYTRTESENLKNKLLYITGKETKSLPEDTFLIDEVIGIEAEDERGNNLGTVTEVIQGKANDVYVISGSGGRKYIPATKEAVKRLDIRAKKIVVDSRLIVESS